MAGVDNVLWSFLTHPIKWIMTILIIIVVFIALVMMIAFVINTESAVKKEQRSIK
jgi:hypothetical protein